MIALISDTHENEVATRKAIEVIKQRNPDFTIHLGDIISPPMLDLFEGMKLKVLLGNNDGEVNGLRKKCEHHGFEGPFEELAIHHQGKKLYCYHGTNKEVLSNNIYYGEFDYVIYGHTHVMDDHKERGTRVINPGALFRAQRYTIAFLDVEKNQLEFVDIKKEGD